MEKDTGGKGVLGKVYQDGAGSVLTVDRNTLLGRIHEDPSLASRLLHIMSRCIRELDTAITQ